MAPKAFSSVVLPTVIIVASAAVIQLSRQGHLQHLLSAAPASSKPYNTFDAFWPHYLGEHSQPWTRRLHFIGTTAFMLTSLTIEPALLLCVLSALALGYASSPFFRAQQTGLVEMALMIGTYLLTGRNITGSFKRTLLPIIIAYGMAWVGHFMIEGNRPATFIYPSYSFCYKYKNLL